MKEGTKSEVRPNVTGRNPEGHGSNYRMILDGKSNQVSERNKIYLC